MTEWQTKIPDGRHNEASSMAVDEVRKLTMSKIKHAMKTFPGQFVWAKPNLLKRIAPDDGKIILDMIKRHPKGISLGVLTNRLRVNYDPDVVAEMAAKLEAGGLIRSTSSQHKYNKLRIVTYFRIDPAHLEAPAAALGLAFATSSTAGSVPAA